MKILVPTDFSPFAGYAIQLAVQLAKKQNAEIHLFNCIELNDTGPALLTEYDYREKLQQAVIEWTKEKLAEASAEIEKTGIKCITHLDSGRYLKTISKLVKEINFDLIVMGSHGASGKEEWLIGSNAQKVIRKLHNNIIVVKDHVDSLDFSKVLFVSNLILEDQEAFRRFLNFISHYDVEQLHIMCVNTEGYFSQPSILIHEALDTFKEIAKGFNVETHFYSEFSIDAGVRHFSEEHDIKLIAISNRVRHPFKRIFQGSNVEMIVNHSKIPVFSIDYEN